MGIQGTPGQNLLGKVIINKWLLFDINLIIFFGTICASVPSSFFARDLQKDNVSPVIAGLILQIHPGMVGLTAWFFGKLIPQFGYKKVALFGVLVEGSAQIGFAFATFVENEIVYTVLAVLLRIVTGTGNSAANTTIYAIAATEFGSKSTLILSQVKAMQGFAYLVGPVVGAGLFKINNTMFLPLVVPGIFYLLAMIRFVIFYNPSRVEKPYTVVKFASAFRLMFHPRLIGPTLAQMCCTGMFGYTVTYLTVYLGELGQSVMTSGILVSLTGLTFMLGSIINGKIIPTYLRYARLTMAIGCFAWALSLSSLTITNKDFVWVVYVAYSMIGYFVSLVVVSVFQFSLKYVEKMDSDLAFNERTSCLAGIWTSANNSGRFIFAVTGGALIQLLGLASKANIVFTTFGGIVTISISALNLIQYLRDKRA